MGGILKHIPEISLVIRNWNALDYLKLTLETIRENTTEIDYELIIVDDNSNEEVTHFLMSLDNAILVLNQEKVGVAEATRQGCRLAQGKHVAILDNDILVPRNWLSGLLEELILNKAKLISPRRQRDLVHPDTYVDIEQAWNNVKIKMSDRSPQEQFLEFSSGRNITEFAKAVIAASKPVITLLTCPPEFLGGSCIVYDRMFVESLGGAVTLPFYPYGGEDVDLCWRSGQAGAFILISGQVHIHHFEHSSVNLNNLDYKKSLHDNNPLLFSTWDDALQSFINREISNGSNIEELTHRYKILKRYIVWKNKDNKRGD